MSTTELPTVLIRPEDAEHPKVDRLRRAVRVEVGDTNAVDRVWVVWASGLTRRWLTEKLDAKGQVLVMPPWTEGGFAGLPPVRRTVAPKSKLLLETGEVTRSFEVIASAAIEQSATWEEHGLFDSSQFAWLASHEPFVGSGRAWLMTAETLVTSPATRPRDAKELTAAVIQYIATYCKRTQKPIESDAVNEDIDPDFKSADIPYLLAAAGLTVAGDVEQAAQFINRRLGVEPDL